MKKEALGVDIGNVIINHRLVDKDDELLYEERYSTIPATDGVFEALKELSDKKFNSGIFLISKCTPWAEEKILQWLKDNDFYNKTGVKRENIFFCRERNEKKDICKKNGITHFVDDRLEVLGNMVGSVSNLFLYQQNQDELNKFLEFSSKVTRVESWSEIVEKILKY